MAQSDLTIQNQSFPSFRSDLNDALSAINTMHSGTSRPSSAVAGTMWLDTTNATSPTIKFFDGTDDIDFATIDYTANTVNFLDSTISFDIVNDVTPQLGGMLDVNGNAIGNGTEELIKFSETASAVNEVTVTNSATGNAPEISATGDDTNIDFKLTPKGTGKLILDGLNFPTADGTTGQFLKTDGSGNLSFDDAGGGGIENITTFLMTTNFTMNSSVNHISTNWSQSGASLGSLVTESSGIFSFPQTGVYMIAVNFALYRVQGDSAYVGIRIYKTNDNSNYDFDTITYTHIGNVTDQHGSLYNEHIFDVTDINNDKIKIYYENENANNIRLIGNSIREQTYVRFIRLGDT